MLQERNMYARMYVCHGDADHSIIYESTSYFAQAYRLNRSVGIRYLNFN